MRSLLKATFVCLTSTLEEPQFQDGDPYTVKWGVEGVCYPPGKSERETASERVRDLICPTLPCMPTTSARTPPPVLGVRGFVPQENYPPGKLQSLDSVLVNVTPNHISLIATACASGLSERGPLRVVHLSRHKRPEG